MSEQYDLSSSAGIEESLLEPLTGSRKVHVSGDHGIQVGMREISLAATPSHDEEGQSKLEVNPSLRVYDTSGPYTDPKVEVDVREGIPRIREQWIIDRDDTEPLEGFTSEFTRTRNADLRLDSLRFAHVATPRRAKSGRNVTQLHYARQGIVTPEMEYIAIRENLARANLEYEGDLQHPGNDFGASIPKGNHPGICPR